MEAFFIPILIAVIVSATPRVKYLAQTLTTITHELGHAVAVMPFGGRLQGIKLRLTTEGEATVGIPRSPFPIYHIVRVLNLFAGYSAPIYLSLFFILCIVNGWEIAVQVALGAMCLLVMFFIRNLFGVLVALGFTAVNVSMMIFAGEVFPQYALTLAFILIIRGITDIYMAGVWTFKRALESSDFVIASKELIGPPQFWYVLFCLFHLPLMGLLSIMVWGTIAEKLI